MGMVECPECKEHIADNAMSCPNCGWVYHKNMPKLENLSKGMMHASVFFLVAGCILVFMGSYAAGSAYSASSASGGLMISGFGALSISLSVYLLLYDIARSLKKRA